ncbi:MAG: sialidase family protein [Thermoplasmatota archaeon]
MANGRLLPVVALLLMAGCVSSAPSGTLQTQGTTTAAETNGAHVAPPAPVVPALTMSCPTPCVTEALPGGELPRVAVDPVDPNHAVVVGDVKINASRDPWPEFATTTNGGANWSMGPIPQFMVGSTQVVMYNYGAEPVISFLDSKNVVVAAVIAHDVPPPECVAILCTAKAGTSVTSFQIAVWKSGDGGKSWGPGSIAVPDMDPTITIATLDRDFGTVHYLGLVRDPVGGTLYLFYHKMGATPSQVQADPSQPFFGAALLYVTSKDGGQSWSQPMTVPTAGPAHGIDAAAYDGHLLVAYRQTSPTFAWLVQSSDNGGQQWSKATVLGSSPMWDTTPVAFWLQDQTLHAVAAHTEGKNDESLVLNFSTDGGKSWGPGESVLSYTPTDGRLPALAIDPATGRGFIAAYQGEGKPDALELWAAPIAHGDVGVAMPIFTSPIKPVNASSYFGVATSQDGGFASFPASNGALMGASVRLS